MKPDDVARYLQSHPDFFDRYSDLLIHLHVPHPHGGRAISITERQILALRERARKFEGKLAELIRFGEDNDAIAEKVHRLATAFAAAPTAAAAVQALQDHLAQDFAVPHVALRLWDDGAGSEAGANRAFVETLSHPHCGTPAGLDPGAWFGEAGSRVRSVAVVPLARDGRGLGVLALGSEDAERFYAEMGTVYLARIGELIVAVLGREEAAPPEAVAAS
ncbi:MAG: DUF484 family protein [Betaproteobacteria bacterium]|nr:DUF484 family protein [Betaproteobacteria bacterium]